MPYNFSLIRFVPDPARGEFVNIGAIAGDDDANDWDIRWISNYKRANALDSAGVLPAAKAFSARLDERISELERPRLDAEPPTLEWLTSLAEDMNNILQVSDPTPVVADSAETALDLVFERLLVDPARPTYRFRKKNEAQAAARQAYSAHNVPRRAVKNHASVISGVYKHEFDFAVHNGHAVQLLQCWSFELPNQDELMEQIKAWAWMAHEIRSHGGRLSCNGEVEVPEDLDIAAVYIPPLEDGNAAFAEAQSAFEELGVSAAPFDSADEIGAKAAEGLGVAPATD